MTKKYKKVSIIKQNIEYKNKDLDPFEIYKDKMEINKPILLVDIGYATFYRFNATKTWYKYAYPEQKEEYSKKDYDWSKNKDFMEKYMYKYGDSILEIAHKFKIRKHNIILGIDCKLKDNWRNDIVNNYKIERTELREKNGFDGEGVFKITYELLLKTLNTNYGFKIFQNNKIEADDINAIITRYYQVNFPNVDIYILATDKDYLQLSNDKLHLIDFKGNILNDEKKDKKLKNGKYQLWFKILGGDISDSIKPLKILKSYIRPDNKTTKTTKTTKPTKPTKNIYINITKKDAEKLALNIEKFLKDIKENPEIINNEQLNINKYMIDFNYIPIQYQENIISELEKLL